MSARVVQSLRNLLSWSCLVLAPHRCCSGHEPHGSTGAGSDISAHSQEVGWVHFRTSLAGLKSMSADVMSWDSRGEMLQEQVDALESETARWALGEYLAFSYLDTASTHLRVGFPGFTG